MPVETATYVSQLNASYPLGSDDSGDGDNHIRLIKSVLKATLPNFSGALASSNTDVDNAVSAVGGLNAILFKNGSAAAPGAAFVSDTDTGFYWDTSGYINISSNGVYAGKFGPGGTLAIQGTLTVGGVDMPFPTGTAMLFAQTTAPTGWTKSTTHNDKALRVVSGTASSGGSVAFSTVFSRSVTDSYQLQLADIPAHSHGITDPGHDHGVTGGTRGGAADGGTTSGPQSTPITSGAIDIVPAVTGITINNAGGNGYHAHGCEMRVQYVDVIIATKN